MASSSTHSLAARDGTIVTIKASAAEQSKTLSGWLEEMEDSSTAFPVSAIEADGETLKEAVEFCEQVAAAPGWDIDDAYRTSGCRVGGHGIYHDHAFCARLPVSMPAPAVAVAPSYPYLASYAVFLLSFASVRLLSSCTRRRETNHEQ